MKKSELMAKLQEIEEDLEVYFTNDGYGDISFDAVGVVEVKEIHTEVLVPPDGKDVRKPYWVRKKVKGVVLI